MGKGYQFGLLLQAVAGIYQARSRPSSVTGTNSRRAPLRWASSCQGTVAVVLHLRQHDQIVCVDIGVAPAIGHEVDALGGIACEDNLLALASIDETCHFYARLFLRRGRLFTDLVDAAMDIGIVAFRNRRS